VVQLGYQSGLDLGTKALKNAAPLTTGLDSGAALKELTKFGTDYTGMKAARLAGALRRRPDEPVQPARRARGHRADRVNQSVAGAGMNAGNNVSALSPGRAMRTPRRRSRKATPTRGGVTSVANWWQQQQMLNSLRGGGTGTPATKPATPGVPANYDYPG
jgi:hypothetical protein